MAVQGAQNGSFLQTTLRCTGKSVHRVGLACNYGIDEAGFLRAVDRGLNYFFWSPFRTSKITRALKETLHRDRDRFVIACGPTLGWFGGNVRRGAEKILRRLAIDQIDVFQLYWLGVSSAWTDATVEELVRLRDEGKVRAIGISIHDRPRAGRLAQDSPLDMMMVRYNAAHPGAEKDIFPHISAGTPEIVSYTATAWRKLLRRPSGWTGDLPEAGDCYRFCLSSPHVALTLMGPKNQAELEQNLDRIEQGPLDDEEMALMRAFGQAAHG